MFNFIHVFFSAILSIFVGQTPVPVPIATSTPIIEVTGESVATITPSVAPKVMVKPVVKTVTPIIVQPLVTPMVKPVQPTTQVTTSIQATTSSAYDELVRQTKIYALQDKIKEIHLKNDPTVQFVEDSTTTEQAAAYAQYNKDETSYQQYVSQIESMSPSIALGNQMIVNNSIMAQYPYQVQAFEAKLQVDTTAINNANADKATQIQKLVDQINSDIAVVQRQIDALQN